MICRTPLGRTALFLATLFLASASLASDDERAARQAELDRACEGARELKLRPIRQQFIEECVREGQFETREECERFYADYGGRTGSRAPLFYDLPECVKAFEYAQSERSSG